MGFSSKSGLWSGVSGLWSGVSGLWSGVSGLAMSSGGPPTITSSDGDPASLSDNGDGTFDVIIDGVNVGTITQAQINAGGFITVVSPVTGMSGNNVVLTTTGYVIHVGSTPIETDVEVLADGVLVGTALPFDATAYPDAALTVRFSYSVGVDELVIDTTARLAPLKIIEFRDGFVSFVVRPSEASPTLNVAWPVGSRGRRMTAVMRVSGTVGATDAPPNIGTISTGAAGGGLTINPFGSGSSARYRFEGSAGAPSRFNAIADGTRRISIMAAIDLDGGLPGGETFVVWASINEAAWSRLGGLTATGASSALALSHIFNGNANGNAIGGNVDLHNHIWLSNQAIDPATNWPNFFNADGTVKDLGVGGVIGGVTPVVYAVGNDFVTLTNRGSGGGALGKNNARQVPTVRNA